VSLPTVDTWVRAGCPIERKGSKGVQSEFDTAKVAKWLRDRAVSDATGDQQQDAAEIDRRTKRAKMRQAELELAKELGQVAPVAEFERVQAARAAMVRTNVLNVRNRATLRLLGETDEATFKQILGEELTLALRTAYETKLELPEDDEPDAAGD
jgi:phage terminase Nu1 subunit (DNA packaging protein)